MPIKPDKQRLRKVALAAAERSVQIEGLPPRDWFARSLDSAYIGGELTADQVARKLADHYQKMGR